MDSWKSGPEWRLMELWELGTEWWAICSLLQKSKPIRDEWLADCVAMLEKLPRKLNPSFIVGNREEMSLYMIDTAGKRGRPCSSHAPRVSPVSLTQNLVRRGDYLTGSTFLGFSPLKILPNIKPLPLLQHGLALWPHAQWKQLSTASRNIRLL